METKNATITAASISNDDHGLLTAWLTLDYGGIAQGFGGYTLYLPPSFDHHDPTGPNYAGEFIWRVMEVAGVQKWDQLKGKTIRVLQMDGQIQAIAHIVKDDFFYPAVVFGLMQREGKAKLDALRKLKEA